MFRLAGKIANFVRATRATTTVEGAMLVLLVFLAALMIIVATGRQTARTL